MADAPLRSSASQIAYYKIKAPTGYWRREYPTRAEARKIREPIGDMGSHEIVGFNLFGKVVWTERLGYAHGSA